MLFNDSSLTAICSVMSRPACVLGCTTRGRPRESNPHRQAAHLGVRRGASGAGTVARAWRWPCGPTALCLTAKRLKHSGGQKDIARTSKGFNSAAD